MPSMLAQITLPACLTGIICMLAAIPGVALAQPDPARDAITIARDDRAVEAKEPAGKTLARYVLQPPAGSGLPVESGCFFHPLTTPSGIVLTDLAPADHPHHRGVFLAWVEMHGRKDADFWGWGEHAPTKDRRIINREVSDIASGPPAGFRARNDWMAEGERVLAEDLLVRVHRSGPANVLDLVYTLTPDADLTLSQWAFSGFCVRTRKAASLEAFGPDGPIGLPNPSHVRPESDWPAATWYDFTLTFDDGRIAGVAVIDHPSNPKSLWHNHRDVRMLNPCIVAPGPVRLMANEPLVLRYRVVAHDGAVPTDLLNRLAAEWRGR